MKKLISIALALCMALSLCVTITWAASLVSAKDFPDSGGGDKPVYWSVGTENNGFAATLNEALIAAYKANDGTKTIEIICKPGADVGTMTHGHVVDNLTIYGNGAYVSGGERDLEIDTDKYSRTTGNLEASKSEELNKNITITVYDLNGIAIWGERRTSYTITASFYNCQNMHKAYITGATGPNVLLFDGCSFDGGAALEANTNTSIYSNAEGSVTIKNTSFKGIAVPINLNNKSSGTQTVTVDNCTFDNCATSEVVTVESTTKQYAAPIRVVAQSDAQTVLTVNNCTFTGESANGDILVGDGRNGKSAVNANVTVTVTNTAAEVQVQESGYYDANGGKDDSKVTKGAVEANQTLNLKTEGGEMTITVEDAPATPDPIPDPEEPSAPAHTPIRRQNTTAVTTTDTTPADTTTKTDTVTSAKTFDVGVAVYGMMAALSLFGMGYVGKKR